MRCPECGHNQRYRQGTTCGRCRYEFVLNPKAAPYCADRRFINAIERVSERGERPYTPAQLHAAIFRRRNRAFVYRWLLAQGSGDVAATRAALVQWTRARRDAGRVLLEPRLDAFDPRWPEPDLYDYGAEAVVVVDDRLVVDLLVGVRLHMLAKVAIVDGAHEYPTAVLERVRSLVAARSDLPLFTLHASGVDADGFEDRTRAALDAPDNPVIDLGLPRDVAKRIRGMRWTRRMSSVPVDLLPHRWLTAGVAAAIARRCSLVDLVTPAAGSASGDGTTLPISWGGDDTGNGHGHDGDFDGDGDGDGDFG